MQQIESSTCSTLPHLELLGAVLLSKLENKALEAMQMTIDAVHRFHYCAIMDKVTQPHRLKYLIANRVIQITDLTSRFKWHHINLMDNPVDSLSRGLSVDDLIRTKIWWSGPDFLHSDDDFSNNWDCSNIDPVYMKELKPIMNTFVQSTVIDFFDDLYKLSNNYMKLI
ncbi:hypothetical protein TNCT_609241 [Trichonephila clavata]|uniref:Uncharacterized protein n=1 Tax=Trichonephila clavata TaxID=2740835 RepID=A0A8X6FSZ5_TRICU|nr:hypothetical protein TNCT_609241 [Trichonephila clavata]